MTGQTVRKVVGYLHGLCDSHQVHIRMQQRLRDAGHAEKRLPFLHTVCQVPPVVNKGIRTGVTAASELR